ncbi:hypothetical protein JA9_004268 [Meyerozyma sp. JA9]|nr:hypothetical protein JA9_004268 [Meyerozyma sp. JA9]
MPQKLHKAIRKCQCRATLKDPKDQPKDHPKGIFSLRLKVTIQDHLQVFLSLRPQYNNHTNSFHSSSDSLLTINNHTSEDFSNNSLLMGKSDTSDHRGIQRVIWSF